MIRGYATHRPNIINYNDNNTLQDGRIGKCHHKCHHIIRGCVSNNDRVAQKRAQAGGVWLDTYIVIAELLYYIRVVREDFF